jgi:hypothetical protein
MPTDPRPSIASAARPMDVNEPRLEPGLQRAGDQITAMLVPGEVIQTLAVQRRLYALFHRRTIVATTSGRLLILTRNLLGGYDLRDIRWQDLKETHLQAGVFTALLTVLAYGLPDLAVNGQLRRISVEGLRKHQAEAVYRICQANEQAWREKRRVRELEELRAKSGGVQIGAQLSGGLSTGDMTANPVQKLEQAKEMLSKGLIGDAEYEALKARIVSSM